MDFREIANISVDCVIFGFNSKGISILLSKRKLHMFERKLPIIDDWVLPGQHILKSESPDESASRIFKNLTGRDECFKKQFCAFGNPDRINNEKDLFWIKSQDVNPRTISVAYYFLLPTYQVSPDNDVTTWFPIKELPQLGFDHNEIISRAFIDLQQEVMNEPIIFEFIPDKFTLNELQTAYEAVLDTKIDNRNFRKKALSKTYIIPLAEKRIGVSKKPANLHMFSRDIYDKTIKKNRIINI